ncbi:MAG: glycosyltransferase [bacterium]|nr:glycosyltransferase [bacterium]
MDIYEIIFLSFLTFTLLGLSWLLFGFHKKQIFTHKTCPSIEVIVSCHNEETILPSLLSSLEHLEWYSDDLSICLVNDRSTDQTGEILKSFVRAHQPKFKYLEVNHLPDTHLNPKKYALSLAISQSHKDWIVTLDADSRPHRRWLIEMFYGFNNDWLAIVPSYRLIGGRGVFFYLRNFETLVQSFLMSAAIKLDHPLSAVGAGFCYKKDAFYKVGGFVNHLNKISGDDDLLLHSLSKLQGKIISKCFPLTTIDIFDRDTEKYWKARKRHYSVASDYPLFWKIFGILVIPGFFFFPMGILLYGIGIWHFFKFSFFLVILLLYLTLIELCIQSVIHYTTHKYQIWYSMAFLFVFPIWLGLVLINTLHPTREWK